MITAGQWTFVKTQCLNVGPQGPTGPTGPIGPAGPAGTDGINYGIGPTGRSGPNGSSGPAGPIGPNGNSAPDRITELSDSRTRSYPIAASTTIILPIYLDDRYQTILLTPTNNAGIIFLNPYELQLGGSVSNFWIILKNTETTKSIRVSERTQYASTRVPVAPQDVFLKNNVDQTFYISGGSSVILYYDNTNIFENGYGRFILI
jgi:Collagen triple helix repeat (20 copies)